MAECHRTTSVLPHAEAPPPAHPRSQMRSMADHKRNNAPCEWAERDGHDDGDGIFLAEKPLQQKPRVHAHACEHECVLARMRA
eukprot:CAMPEP_0203948902 /NCGR_PEP_ID=MMETSP0359-20131031/83449_1 /ASSEMBLY_ACC=CAM_ASM_000338 /TAXON_ID=268821 /ORGANISM="Scrippsiella Hangoei, Strain SHTV-5" /LENGTH=82 /DNA_ID=CAMNT_0050880641 /DNA_START=76 /DNA_END=322 /DNA_ORIENTATION=+